MPTPHERDWIDYALAVAPFIAMVISIGVALTQAYLQRQSLKHDLYNKRYRVFKAVQEILTAPEFTKNAPQLVNNLRNETAEVTYLYGKEIGTLIYETETVLREITWAEQVFNNPARTKEEEKAFATAIVHWVALNPKAERMFRPYLQLYHEQSLFSRIAARLNAWIDSAPETLAKRYTEAQ